jgi:membrane protein DedA with SNARE-associated domain
LGAFIWTVTYIFIGRFLGNHWRQIMAAVHHKLLFGGIILGILVLLVYFFTNWKIKDAKD